MAWTAIGTSLFPVIMMDGNRVAAVLQPLQQFQAGHSRQVGIDQETSFSARTIGFEEALAGREILDSPPVGLEQAANSLAHVAIVIDHENDRRFG